MSIHNNFPTFGWVKLDGISIIKDKQVHIVKDFKTNLKYIYWSSEVPNNLTASNVMLSRTATRFLIVTNNKGECVLVPNEKLIVSFDGNSVGAINEHIWGLYEKDEEFGNRFVSVEQNIEGITTTVGQTQEELGKVSEQVSKVEQKADSIDLSVKNLDKTYNDDKEMQALREGVNKSIIDVNSALGLFKSKINETFKDNEISDDEYNEIQAQIEVLRDRESKVVDQVDKVIALMEAEGDVNSVTKLESQKTSFVNAIDNVVTLINTAISDRVIVPSEITVVTDAFAKANLSVNTLKNTVDEIILLGTGGVISEELARIGMKSDEISLSVSKVEEKIDSETASLKNELTGQIKDVSDALNGLEDTMNNSFLDGVLSDSEKIALRRNLDTLATEKLDIDKQYESLYGNVDLTGTPKTELKTSYDNYILKYNELVSAIDAVINKEGNISIEEQSRVNSCIIAHRNALGEYSTKASKAIDAIASNKVGTVDKKYSEILLTPDGIVSRVGRVETQADANGNRLYSAESKIEQLSDKITSTVTEGDVKSIIEQSPDEIRYGFNGISDYVTIGTYGLNVRRGSIACDSIVSSSSNPIIKLFDGNGMMCALDATAYMNEGVGTAIRLKRDNANYINVGAGSVAFYLTGSSQNGSALCTFTGRDNYFKQVSKGGTLEMNSGLWYNSTRVSMEGHAHPWGSITGKPSTFTPSSHNHSGEDLNVYNLTCRAFGNGSSTLMYNSLDGNGKNLGWSGSKFNQVSAKSVWGDEGSWSDRKLKENIRYLDNVGSTITAFSIGENLTLNENPLTKSDIRIEKEDLFNFIKDDLKLTQYNYIDGMVNENFNNKINFIANDVIKTKVGQVLCGEHEGDLAYNLNNYISIIAGALQCEIEKRENLEKEVNELRDQVKTLTDLVNKMVNI